MAATTDEILYKEHLLAEKAQGILEHQQELKALNQQKKELRQKKPTVAKERLSYLESIEFGKKVEAYENDLKNIDLKIQKVTRELSALNKQAKKLLPAPGVRIKVSTHPDDDSPVQMFCIQYIQPELAAETEEQFQIQPLKE